MIPYTKSDYPLSGIIFLQLSLRCGDNSPSQIVYACVDNLLFQIVYARVHNLDYSLWNHYVKDHLRGGAAVLG